MHAVRKLSNQTVHLGSHPERYGLPIMHREQYPSGLPCPVGPSQELLALGRAEENQGNSNTEGETCLRCAALFLERERYCLFCCPVICK